MVAATSAQGLSLDILDAGAGPPGAGRDAAAIHRCAIVNGIDPFKDAAIARLSGTGTRWTYEEIDPDVFGEELDHGVYTTADRIAAVLLTVTQPE